MKTKIYVMLLFIALIVTGPMNAQTLVTAKPSIEGRASVADEGVLPKGLYAKSSLFLPGDSVSVTNPATGITLSVLILGPAESSNGTAIHLSPEAAVRLFIAKGTETLVSMTKKVAPPNPSSSSAPPPYRRTVDPDRHPEDAIPGSLGAKLVESVRTPAVDDNLAKLEAEDIRPDPRPSAAANPSKSDDAPAVNNPAKTPDVWAAPYSEPAKTPDVWAAPYSEPAKNPDVWSAPYTELVKTDDVRTDPYGDLAKTDDVRFAPVREAAKTTVDPPAPIKEAAKTAVESSAPLNNSAGKDDIIPAPVKEPVKTVEEPPASLSNYDRNDDLRLAPYSDLAKTEDVRSVPYRDLTKTDDVRFAPVKGAAKTTVDPPAPVTEPTKTVEESAAPLNNYGRNDDLRLAPYSDLAKTEDVRTVPYNEPAKTPYVRSVPPKNLPKVETVRPSSDRDSVKAPELESPKVDEEGSEITVVGVNPTSPNPPPQSPTPDPPDLSPASQSPSSVTPRLNELVVLENNLIRGFYYVQIATMSDERNIDFLLSKYRERYNFALVPSRTNAASYRVMVGPLTADEYGVVLNRFQGSGYGDAFVKRIQ